MKKQRRDKTTKQALKTKFKPTFKGLVLTLDSKLLKSDLSANARLVFAGIMADIPKAAIVDDIFKYRKLGYTEYYHKHTKSKVRLIEKLGISASSFYRGINELEEHKYLTTMYNTHQNGANSTAFYLLHKTIDFNEEGRVQITSEMLMRQYVRTKRQSKTLSANSKIILALLAQESRKSYKREVKANVTEVSKKFNIPLSTVYYLLDRFVACSAITRNKDLDKLVLVILDEMITNERKRNEETSGTHAKKIDTKTKEKVIPDEVPSFIAEYMRK